MKKLIPVVALILALCLLTACTDTVYKPQQNITLNYNNLSAGDPGYWLTNDQMVYGDLFEGEYRVGLKNNTETYALSKKDPWYYSTMQQHGNLVYYATHYDIDNPESNTAQVFVYNTVAKTEESLIITATWRNFTISIPFPCWE